MKLVEISMNSIMNSAHVKKWTAELAVIASIEAAKRAENSRLIFHTSEEERASNSNFDNLIDINHQDTSLCYCL